MSWVPGGPSEWSRQWWDLWTTTAKAAVPLGSPFDPVNALLEAARTRLIGEERTYRVGRRDVTMTLDELTVSGKEIGRSFGQYGDVRLVARDLQLEGERADRLHAVAHNMHLSMTTGVPTLIAAPVRWTLAVSPPVMRARLARSFPTWELDFLEAEVTIRHRLRGRGMSLTAAPFAEGRSIRVVPRRLAVGKRLLRLRLPSYNIALPALPESDWLTGLMVGPERVEISGIRAEWRRSLTKDDVDRLLRTIRDKVRNLEL